MKQDLQLEIELVEGVTANLEGTTLKVKGPKGEVERNFAHPRINVTIEGSKIILKSAKATKREKTILGSYNAHMKNMVKGVVEPFQYKVKICSGHFPMNVSMSGQELIVKNFLGEAVPRRIMMPEGTKVKVNGTEIDISSANKELAGQAASRIENLCRITNRDRRIFQDGLYITEKAK
ncbi:50S ribosomal protein L6 [Candidatus Woesearchaeota archaeon]|nr:50S ribosomal protein L6 [Candidatus Woesearchaeota archaeon]MBT4151168.1 50S ribosomal protein L6 [Candidatus Woesearchaeota archaeon]MBT4247600.1 50S ribosomal protein L6 [Candidatus Woesearchaeota archaeon]MBT4433954.1 50S ribosomal protein L6 [Candidatus Woesearchaeota archaeon]MBT7331649.1 50S ribosomal protein L6 [Candidatus Woesearchaeota archaeon]